MRISGGLDGGGCGLSILRCTAIFPCVSGCSGGFLRSDHNPLLCSGWNGDLGALNALGAGCGGDGGVGGGGGGEDVLAGRLVVLCLDFLANELNGVNGDGVNVGGVVEDDALARHRRLLWGLLVFPRPVGIPNEVHGSHVGGGGGGGGADCCDFHVVVEVASQSEVCGGDGGDGGGVGVSGGLRTLPSLANLIQIYLQEGTSARRPPPLVRATATRTCHECLFPSQCKAKKKTD